MRWMKPDRIVKGDWVEHKDREWIVSAPPEPQDVTVPGSPTVLCLSRIDGREARMRVPEGEVVKVTREWKAKV